MIDYFSLRDGVNNHRDHIEDIKERFSLSSVIAESIRLIGRNGKYMACCPFHDDSTPSLSIRDDIGLFHCFGCGAKGDVIDYIQMCEDVSFSEACRRLENGYVATAPVRATEGESDAERSRAARNIWNACHPIEGTPAAEYLENRALPVEFTSQQENLRFGRLSFDHSSKKHPALVAAARDADGQVVAIQRIFLTEGGDKLGADCKRSLGPCKGAAIRLTGIDGASGSLDHIHVCEGLEDGLTIARLRDGQVWVTMGAANLASVELSPSCNTVTIGTDNDEAGLRATEQAKAKFVKAGKDVMVLAPPSNFKDWNAYLVYWELDYNDLLGNDLPWRWVDEDDVPEYFGEQEGDLLEASGPMDPDNLEGLA